MLKHIFDHALINPRHLFFIFLSLFPCFTMAEAAQNSHELYSSEWSSSKPDPKPVETAKTPVGLWITYDSKTKASVSMIRIINDNGTLKGTVEKILAPEYINKRCSACTGANKGQPLLGLEVLTNMRLVGGVWKDGKILDTNSGKTYSALLKLPGKGDRLEVRGFLGSPLIGRSQFWTRVYETSY